LSWRVPAIVLAVIAVASAGAFLYSRTRQPDSAAAGTLPPPPDAAKVPAAVRGHLDTTYRAARQTPSSVSAVGAYCVALHADMFYEAADRCYRVAIERSGGEWQWLYYRSLIRFDLGGGQDLASDLRTVTARVPGFSPAWLRLGDAEFKAGRYEDAERAWLRAIEVPEPRRLSDAPVPHVVEVPAASYASLGLARISLINGDTSAARQTLERVLAGGPAFSSAYRLLADVEAMDGRTPEEARARARARKLPPYAAYADPMLDVLALESRNSTFLLRVASEANLALNAAWSEFLTRRALEFDPDNPEVVLKLARVLRTLRRSDEALTYFQRYQQMVPGDVQVLADIGSCLSDLGRFAEAEPLLRKAVASLDDPISHYNLGLLFAVTGRVDEAIAEYERALERDPGDVTARSNLAAAFVRKGELRRAVQELQRVLAIDAENPLALTNLGLVRVQQGDVAGARRALTEALRLDPGLEPAAEALKSLPR
jgi:tetratricopeptide (TPR) repeat protein